MKRTGVAVLFGLVAISACSAFGSDSSSTPGPGSGNDASTSSQNDGSTDPDANGVITNRGDGGADSGAVLHIPCPANALQCEDFEDAEYKSGWQTKPSKLMKLIPNEDPLHLGVGKVVVDSDPISDVEALETAYIVPEGDGANVAIDLLIRVDTLLDGQLVEVARINTEPFRAHLDLSGVASQVVVSMATYSFLQGKELGSTAIGVITDHGWHTLHLDVDVAKSVSPTQRQYRAQLDMGTPVPNAVPGQEGKGGTATLRFGVGFNGTPQGWVSPGPIKFAIDDIVLAAKSPP